MKLKHGLNQFYKSFYLSSIYVKYKPILQLILSFYSWYYYLMLIRLCNVFPRNLYEPINMILWSDMGYVSLNDTKYDTYGSLFFLESNGQISIVALIDHLPYSLICLMNIYHLHITLHICMNIYDVIFHWKGKNISDVIIDKLEKPIQRPCVWVR